MWVRFMGQEDPLEEGMATHSSILAWRIPGTEEPGRFHPIELQSRTQLKQLNTHTHTHTHTPPLWVWVKSGVESMSKMPSLPLGGMRYRIQLSKPLGMEIRQWQFYPRAKFGLMKRQGCPFAGVHSSTSNYVFLNMEFMSSWQHLVFRMCLGKRN